MFYTNISTKFVPKLSEYPNLDSFCPNFDDICTKITQIWMILVQIFQQNL